MTAARRQDPPDDPPPVNLAAARLLVTKSRRFMVPQSKHIGEMCVAIEQMAEEIERLRKERDQRSATEAPRGLRCTDTEDT